ncbi:MAG: hypothetical protein ACYS22_06525 [Planctomycetota bacterium]|jgi:hypothetical protein
MQPEEKPPWWIERRRKRRAKRQELAAAREAARRLNPPRRGLKKGGKRPKSFIEVWDRWYPLPEVSLSVAIHERDAGEGLAEMDLLGERSGREATGLAVDRLVLESVSRVEDLVGRVLIDAPEDQGLLTRIKSLAAPSGVAGLDLADDSATEPDVLDEPHDTEPSDGGASRKVLEAWADLEDLEELDGAPFEDEEAAEDDPYVGLEREDYERALFIPSAGFWIQRLRIEFGGIGAGHVRMLMHAEADAYDADGELCDESVPIYAELLARLETIR